MRNTFAMDRGRWLALSPYIDRALDLPTADLDVWLRTLEPVEPQIAADLRVVLAAQAGGRFASFMNGPALVPTAEIQHVRRGELIGNYRLLRELGQGGAAGVYLAERADGHFERRVALKVLRFGPDGSEARRHFAQERQILASLEHPAIARLLDGGVTTTGLPYLVMEYVEGMTIDLYCEARHLSIDERLRLFIKVSAAVQYAHGRSIVHRDLKPSNIMITADGTAKLLDFGIAKLLEPERMAHAAPPTRDVIRLMTPEYASPEQARGGPVTLATDIYQLGLLLYELLTDHAPYKLQGCKPFEALRIICESEPVRPSRFRRQLRHDLDAVLLRALRKEPERRYASVEQFTDDIVRYLEGRPVHAHAGNWVYRAGKLVRRHSGTLVTTAAVICGFTLIILWYTIQLARERDRAATVAQRARRDEAVALQISEFIVNVANEPAVQGRLLNVIGDAYLQYELNDKAQPLLERALQRNTQAFGPSSKEVADSKHALARLALNRGEYQRSRRLYEETVDIREHELGSRAVKTADALSELAYALCHLGETQGALSAAERAIDIYRHTLVEKCLLAQGRVSEVEPVIRESARQWENRLNQQRRFALQRLIRLFETKGDVESAQRLQKELTTLERELRTL